MLYLIVPLIWILIAGTVFLAWWRGGMAERMGALLVLIGGVIVWLIHLLAPVAVQPLALLMGEAGLALGFLLLAMRFLSPWLGVAMLLQAAQFSLHAYYIIGEKPHDYLYKLVNNINTLAILFVILAATLITWRRRSRSAAK